MADIAGGHSCCFLWEIRNPFVDWRPWTATFYHGSPTVTQWNVSLSFTSWSVGRRDFTISLQCVVLDRLESIRTERVEVIYSLNNRGLSMEERNRYLFNEANWYTCTFQASVNADPREEPDELMIEVKISFPDEYVMNRVDNGLFYDNTDIRRLSEDLLRLFVEYVFYNMRLYIAERVNAFFLVHSCILRGRWNNFFRIHNLEANPRGIHTGISEVLLRDILTYMYSGILDLGWPNWRQVDYTTELFQVIDRYRLYHLYKTFVRDDSQQKRITIQHSLITILSFSLDDDDYVQFDNHPYSRIVQMNPEHDYEFLFKIVVFMMEDVPAFEYTLESRCPFRLAVHVSLEFFWKIKQRGGPVRIRQRSSLVHEREYIINPNQVVSSGYCRFERTAARLLTYVLRDRCRIWRENDNFIRCTFTFSNGTTVFQVENVDDEELQNDLERFEVLSDHMHLIKQQPEDMDFTFLCPTELNDPLDPEIPYSYYIHKPIFAIRVPGFKEALANVPESKMLRSPLRRQAFQSVLDYAYTGKVNRIPIAFLDEVDQYAEENSFEPLQNLVNRIRQNEQN